jgi:RNA polymerase sigma-70 factor, ECF subfamily
MPARDVTVALQRLADGHPSAADDLLPLVYDELRGLARSMLGKRAGSHTLQPTALVHEAAARLLVKDSPQWASRAHFFAVAAIAMRQILCNHARGKRALKRAAPGQRVTLADAAAPTDPSRAIDVLELDEALGRLDAMDPRQARLVELRFFGGMTSDEAAHVMGISTATAEREWRAARAWLSGELRSGEAEDRTDGGGGKGGKKGAR